MKILTIFFEKSYSVGLLGEYSDKVTEEFTAWFDEMIMEGKEIEYQNVDELIFDKLTTQDKTRVRNLIEQYSE